MFATLFPHTVAPMVPVPACFAMETGMAPKLDWDGSKRALVSAGVASGDCGSLF